MSSLRVSDHAREPFAILVIRAARPERWRCRLRQSARNPDTGKTDRALISVSRAAPARTSRSPDGCMETHRNRPGSEVLLLMDTQLGLVALRSDDVATARQELTAREPQSRRICSSESSADSRNTRPDTPPSRATGATRATWAASNEQLAQVLAALGDRSGIAELGLKY